MQGITAFGRCGGTDVPQPRLVQAAHEFEAQLMKELLRPLSTINDDDGTNAESGGALSEFAGEALGQSLSRSGGFGISAGILHSLSCNGRGQEPEPIQGNESDLRGIAFK